MAATFLTEVFIVERMLASGHPDLDDLPCDATVCTSEHQAYCIALKKIIHYALLDNNLEHYQEAHLRNEMENILQRRRISVKTKFKRLQNLLIDASCVYQAEKTYFNVKRTFIHNEDVDEQAIIQESLEQLVAAGNNAAEASGSRATQPRLESPPLPDPTLQRGADRGEAASSPPAPKRLKFASDEMK